MKKTTRTLGLVLGFAFTMSAADATTTTENNANEKSDKKTEAIKVPKKYEIKNGLIGVNRDINSTLTKYMKTEDIRQLYGVDAIYCEWKKHFLFGKFRSKERERHIDISCFSSNSLLNNLILKDLVYSCPGYPCIFMLLLNKPQYQRNICFSAFGCLLKKIWKNAKGNPKIFNEKLHEGVDKDGNDLFTFWAQILFGFAKLNPKSLEYFDNNESELLEYFDSKLISYDFAPKLQDHYSNELLDHASIIWIKGVIIFKNLIIFFTMHGVDFDIPAPNGRTVFHYFPVLKKWSDISKKAVPIEMD
ncbi:MAG: hypothetical protein LBB12_02110 [Holosporaceae bacterium]|jgi:hypothetical protein|nr:hypothetical protein [Holosporaceae bacterium]